MKKPHRATVFVENAEILSQEAHPGDQFVLRVKAPEVAAHARPGTFAHIQCDRNRPMRRPLSIMRVETRGGTVEFLYKAVGEGTRLLSQRRAGERLSVIGPLGSAFVPRMERPRPLLIGGGVGMPPMIFLADALRAVKGAYTPFIVLGSEVPFPFTPRPSQIMVPGMSEGVIGAMPLLEDWGFASRLASQQERAGCYRGYVTDVARVWLEALDEAQRREVEVFACGPHPMLEAVAALAREFHLPCHVSLEEFMACGVGGCAGCVVRVQTDQGPAMKRVCVDGPVFDAQAVFASP